MIDELPSAVERSLKAPAWAGRRADARRNHERVLLAAIEVFTELGLDATIPQIAERAGVGKATVYRSYPTKAELVRAIAEMQVEWLDDFLEEAAAEAETDALGALTRYLDGMATRLTEDRLMLDIFSGVEVERPDDRADRAMDHLLACGRAQGTLRPDVSRLDVQVLMGGSARMLIALGIREPEAWRRYGRLVLAALRSEDSDPTALS